MPGIVNYGGFVLAALLLNITPGADTIYILSRAASGGRRCGVVSALGISTGILGHTVLAALGLSAILAVSARAFMAVKLLGAGYLVFLGVKTLLRKDAALAAGNGEKPGNLWAVYRQGVLTNLLNPKAAVFFLAFLPGYVDANAGYGPLPFLLLGLTFMGTSTLWSLVVAWFGSLLAGLLHRSERVGRITNKVVGCVYIALGLNLLRAEA